MISIYNEEALEKMNILKGRLYEILEGKFKGVCTNIQVSGCADYKLNSYEIKLHWKIGEKKFGYQVLIPFMFDTIPFSVVCNKEVERFECEILKMIVKEINKND